MIDNTPDPTAYGLIELHDSELEWHPCGSRFFGDADDTSDFDFFCDSPEAPGWLVENGWPATTLKYKDLNTIATYIKGKVNAIVVADSKLRLLAQQKMTGQSKAFRKLTANWNTIYKELNG